jgi:NAD(P)H-hydrate epimerase
MPKIFSSDQVRAWDAYTIANESVSSIQLMERAGRAAADWIAGHVESGARVGLLCGTGNNGGDGLVIARLLAQWQFPVTVWLVELGRRSADFELNLHRLPAQVKIVHFNVNVTLEDCDVWIDALLGSGLARPAEGIVASAIKQFNNTKGKKIAIDLPSGLFADVPSMGAVIKADYTLAFQRPRLAFFLPENDQYVGQVFTLGIGLAKDFENQTASDYHYATAATVKKLLLPRRKYAHKGDYGRLLLVAGSYGMTGAATLASRATLRSGAGLLTVHAPRCATHILQTTIPEAMVSADEVDNYVSNVPANGRFDAVAIGPGLGQHPATVAAVQQVLQWGKPCVIDADALNILAVHRHLLASVPAGSVLTPHLKEFERLAGESQNSFERLAKQQALARQLKSVVLVKGAHTAIATPEGAIIFNTTGNPGMATAGSGDVLTGVISALLGQGYPCHEAAVVGVYLHGLAGDKAAFDLGMESVIASDLIEYLPVAFKSLGNG